MKKFLVIIFLLLIPTILAMQVKVEIEGLITGKVGYFEYDDVVEGIEKILVEWENTGSVGCKSRLKVNFINGSDIVYTGWSAEEALEPGDHAPLEVYWYPENGEYLADVKIIHCNEAIDLEIINFTVNKTESKEMPIQITTSSTENYVEFKIKSDQELDDIAITPENYPLGWIFESGKIESIDIGEEKILRVAYSPPIWKSKTIKFNIVTRDGEYKTETDVKLEKGIDYERIFLNNFLLGLGLISIISIVLNVFLLRKKIVNFFNKLIR